MYNFIPTRSKNSTDQFKLKKPTELGTERTSQVLSLIPFFRGHGWVTATVYTYCRKVI